MRRWLSIVLAATLAACSAGGEDELVLPDPDGESGKADGPETGLGAKDDVLDGDGHVKAHFPLSPENVVAAALFELHRGADRTIEEILADDTFARLQRGPRAAKEGRAAGSVKGNNWDARGFQTIAKVGNTSYGPIGTYLRGVGLTKSNPWCGAFATFVYRRVGVVIDSMAATREIPKAFATSGDAAISGAYFQISGDENDGSHHRGSLEVGLHGEEPTFLPALVTSLKDLDVRAGDIMWWDHGNGRGHAGVIIGVYLTDTEARIATIEGNVSDRLQARMHAVYLTDEGDLLADFKGWGRPVEFTLATPNDRTVESGWMKAAADELPVFEELDDR